MKSAFLIVVLVVGCTRSTESNQSTGSSAPSPQISTDAPDPVVAVDAEVPAAPASDAAVAPASDAAVTPTRDAAVAARRDAATPAADPKQAACSADADCVLTMIPAEPACCRSLCNPRAVAKAALPALEIKQKELICAAVLCAPPAPCPRPRSLRATCQQGACVTSP